MMNARSPNAGQVGPQTQAEWIALLTEDGLTREAATWFLKHHVRPNRLTPVEARETAIKCLCGPSSAARR
mgnify:CR=1 FL=1